ncbi:hypothetical protein IFO70_33345 [Phormidium tenue FACHB-886]|nr:hypothetical protein [Phormidium tenue FACHB-886]
MSKTYQQTVDALQGICDQRLDSADGSTVQVDRKTVETTLIQSSGGLRRDSYDLDASQLRKLALRARQAQAVMDNGKPKQRG